MKDGFPPTLALVDDRADLRGTTALLLRNELPPDWRVREVEPPADITDVAQILEDGTAAVLVDLRLGDRALSNGEFAAYNGFELASEVRKLRPELPIFMITAFKDQISGAEVVVDDVFTRSLLGADAHLERYVPRIVRSAQRYLSANLQALSRYSVLSQKYAAGELTENERTELAAHQETLNLSASSLDVRERLEAEISSVEALERELRKEIERLEERLKGEG
jgi:DNA-binding NarL/FixJ family response regulator